jgi:hypothetical protein
VCEKNSPVFGDFCGDCDSGRSGQFSDLNFVFKEEIPLYTYAASFKSGYRGKFVKYQV